MCTFGCMIIYAPDRSVLMSVPILPDSVHVEELMRSDEVTLVWNSDGNATLPEGAYITLEDGESFFLLEPYTPTQKKENHWRYEPVFVSRFFSLSKVPFYMYTYEDEDVTHPITSREPDWSLTAYASVFLEHVCRAIYNETGINYDHAVASDLTEFKTVTFNAVDIISALSAIANAFETEFWLEKYPDDDPSGYDGKIHLSFAKNGTEKALTVGANVNVPSVSESGEPYYNRFVALGSTRNIVQDYKGANVNAIASKRLTLDPTNYPGGYIDFSGGGKVYTKILQFDGIYPSATNLVIKNIQARVMYELDSETKERIPIGTSGGQTVYSMYTIWYVQLKVKEGNTYTDFQFDDSTYDKDNNQHGMVLPGLVPSLHFNSGPLNGRDFEVIYHKTSGSNNPGDKGESGPFTWNADSFEIVFTREGKYIIPDQSSLIPTDDNKVVLFNVRTPQEYYGDAYSRLEQAALKEINDNYIQLEGNTPKTDSSGNILRVDKNSYQLKSNPVAFNTSNPDLKIGDAVLYSNSGYTLSTRVTAFSTKLDYPVKQEITIGNSIIKGTLQELKEEAASANTNIDLLSALNVSTQQILDAYNRTQQMILNGLADDFFEQNGTLSPLVQLKADYTYLGPKGGLFFSGATLTGTPTPDLYVDTVNGQRVLRSPLPLITGGDQIVISGTPGQGGGGGGGASYLHDLLDVYGHESETVKQADGDPVADGDLLSFHRTLNAWVALPRTELLSAYYTSTQTNSAISAAIAALNLGTASTYNVGSVASGNTGLVTGGAVHSAINDAVASALKFQGTTTTAISDGSTTNPITVNGSSYTAKKGDVVLYDGKEYLWTGSAWEQLGDEVSWALKTTTISAGTGLTGGGSLAANRTISLSSATIASLALADTAYQKPSTGIPLDHLASGVQTSLGKADTALQSGDIKTLTLKIGTITVGTYTPTTAKTLTISAQNLYDTIGSTKYAPYHSGGYVTIDTAQTISGKKTFSHAEGIVIGSANIWWDSQKGALRIDKPLITEGDQIVIDGTPGGGSGGGASYLHDLLDVYGHENEAVRRDPAYWSSPSVPENAQPGDLLMLKTYTGGNQWAAVPTTAVGITTDATQSAHGLMSAADKTKLDGIEAGANNYTHPTGGANVTITAANGKVLSAITVNNLGHVTSVSSKTLAAADIPSITKSKISDFPTTWALADITGADDLKLIEALTGAGLLRRKANNTWELDSSAYLTSVAFGDLTSHPTTLAGYGITDGVNDVEVSGSGNAVTTASISGHKLTLTKGTTFLTSHQTIYDLVVKNSAGTTVLTYKPATSGTYELTLTKGMVGLGNVDNLAASGYFTALSSGSTNLLSITVGGTTKTLTTLYASRLTTVSKTAWGQTFWTANGIPDSISGDMSSVGKITFTAKSSRDTGNILEVVTENGVTYLYTPLPLITGGDQIVIDGTPGGGGSGGGITLYDYAQVKAMTQNVALTAPTAWAMHQFYEDVFGSGSSTIASRLTAVENRATSVSVTQVVSSGTKIATITVDSVGTDLYAPNYSLPIASASVLGGVKVGSGLSIDASTGVLTATYSYTLPLAANGTRGGIQIGYSGSGKNYPVQLSSEKAYVNVPWTDTTYKLTLNGTTNGDSTNGTSLGTIYAPDAGGATNKVLIGKGGTAKPDWSSFFVTGTSGEIYNLQNGEDAFRYRNSISTDYVDLAVYTRDAEGYVNPKNGIYMVNRGGSTASLIAFTGSGSTSGLDLYFNYTRGSDLKIRRRIDSNRLSGDWEDLLTSVNYASYNPILNSASTHATSSSVIYAPTTAGTNNYILKSNGSGAPTWIAQSDIVAGKLGSATVGSSVRPIYLNAGVATQVSSVETTFLKEPAYVAGGITITTLPLINTAGANRLIFLPADQVIIEKTTDGGATWVSYGATDGDKRRLFVGNTNGGSIQIPLIDGVRNKLCGIRITITAMKYDVPANTAETNKYSYWNKDHVLSVERYCSLEGCYIWLNAFADKIRTRIYRATGANPNNWVAADSNSDMYLSGWSGGNFIALPGATTFGGGTTQTGNYWNYRIVCFTDGANGGDLSTSSTSSAQSVNRIQGFGRNIWTSPNNFASISHLYNWDENQNAIFPAAVRPFANNTYTLGTSGYRWSNIYSVLGNFSGALTVASGGATIKGTGNAVLNINGATATVDYSHLFVTGGTSNTRPLVLQYGYGNVGIGVTQPAYKLAVDGTFNATGAATLSSTLSVASLATLSGGATIPVNKKLTIGDAEIEWIPNSGNGYLKISKPLVTEGDQIVISGTPGGGGSGGATTLAQLDDVLLTSPSNGDLLQYNGSAWVNVAASTVGRIYSAGTGISISNANVIANTGVLSIGSKTGAITLGANLNISNGGELSATDTTYSNGTGIALNGTVFSLDVNGAKTALGLGTASTYAVASSVTQNDTTHLVTGAAVWTAIDNLPEPMVFKGSLGTGGTITALPVNGTAQIGDTYKVITAGTYAGLTAKVGDTFICDSKTSSANTWVLIPSGDEPSGTVTSVAMTVPTGLSVTGSPITTSGTLAISFASGYSIPTTAKQGNWDTAYSTVTTSQTKNKVFASPSNASGAPSFRALVAADIPNLDWSKITSGKPTNLSGYGITDAQPLDADLTAIAGLTGTTGVLKKTAANTWALDTNIETYAGNGNTAYGYFSNGILPVGKGGTNKSSWTQYGVVYASASTTLAQVSNNTTATRKFLRMTGTGSAAAAPAWDTVTKSDVGLGNVDNTADADKAVLSATKLTTVSKKIWGQTYWTSNGIPQDVTAAPNLYIGTTKVQTSSAAQAVTGITTLTASGLIKTSNYVQATRFYLTDDIYFEYDSTNQYVKLNAPFVTSGDQIVISGTPGGGGGGGATTLAALDDVSLTSLASGNLLQYDGSAWVNVAATSVGKIYSAGTGISLGGTNSTVINHSNSVTAKTSYGSTATTASADGGTIKVTDVKYDAQGHITASTDRTITLSQVKNTAGATDISTKIFLIGASTQGANPQTYSDDQVYVTSGNLTANKFNSLTLSAQTTGFKISGGTTSKTLTVSESYTLGAACAKAVVTSIDTSASLPTSNAVKTFVEGKGYLTSVAFADLTAHPTTLNGYGITDAQPLDADLTAIAAISTGTGLLKRSVSGSTVTWSIDTNTYLTGNQTITLSGDVSGSGSTSISVSIGSGKVTNTMLAGSINWSKLLASSIPTTISGYGITDAKFGTAGTDYIPITLGSTTKNVLTAHQSVTLASGTNNGTMKLTVNGTATDNIAVKGLGSMAYETASNYVPTSRTVNSKALSANITLTLDDIGNGSTRSLANYVLKAGDTMTGDLAIRKSGGGVLSIYGTAHNVDAGEIVFQSMGTQVRNGIKISAVAGGTAYDLEDLVFYTSENKTSPYAPIWVEAMRIKSNADIVAPSFSGESTFKDGIILPNAKSIKVTDTADTPNVMNALYLSSNNNLIIGSGVASQSYNTYIDGYSLRFRTNNNQTLALYIDASGNVGVGTSTTLTSKFTVDGSLTATTVNGYTLAAACAKAVTDSSSASAIGTGTSLPTERDIYYGLPTINNAHNYTSSTTIYAPTGAGTSGYWLKASGGTSAPVWESTANLTAGKATADGDGNTISSTYLKLAGGTMTGDITMTNGEFINAASGYAMLGIGSGGTTFYCGPGNEISSSFLLRSGDIDLTHAKAGTNYKIWDASNSNLSTVSWAANDITAAGSVTAVGGGTFDTITLTNTSAAAHLAFGRGGYNYITAPGSGSIAFVPNGLSTNTANSRLLVSDTEVAITKASGGARLAIQGTTANQAAGEIWFRARSSSYNGVKIIGVQGATSNSYDRIALEIQAANGTSSSNVTWKRAMRVTYGANVIIGASGATVTFTQYGDMTINGSITSTGDQVVSSDATLKTNWRGLNYGVADIAKATAGVFDWKDGRGSSAGTVAQDWKKLVPELVHGEDGNMTLAYGQVAMLNTILLARKSEDHEERIKALEAENKKLKEEINRLRMN